MPKTKITTLVSAMLAVMVAGYPLTGYPLYWANDLLRAGAVWTATWGFLAWILWRWQPRLAPILYSSLLLTYLAFGVGIVPAISVIFFFVSAHALGYLALGALYRSRNERGGWIESLAVGLLLIIALWSRLIHDAINTRGLYLALLSLPPAIAWHRDSSRMAAAYAGTFARLRTSAENIYFPLFAVLGLLVGWIACYSFFPSIGPDDNVHHLRMWTEISHLHKYTFDFTSQSLAVVPFAVDLLHTIVSTLAGEDARGALDLVFMLLILGQIAIILRGLGQSPVDQALLVLLTASTPLFTVLLIALQNELFLAFLCMTGMRLILGWPGGWRNVVAVLAVAAVAVATKLTGIVLGVFLLAALWVRVRFLAQPVSPPIARPNTAALLVLLGSMCFAALYPYTTAYIKTGNPVFPFYNKIFESRFFPIENFLDARWLTGFSLQSYWSVFFNTTKHMEAGNFVAGFQYLILLPAAALLAWRRSVPHALKMILLTTLGFGLVMFYSLQYWRYVFPVLPLANVAMASLLVSRDGYPAYAVRGLIIACICLNIFFYPGIHWMFTVPPSALITEGGKSDFQKVFFSMAEVIKRLNRDAPDSRVLFPQAPSGATLKGTPLYVAWYSHHRFERFNGIKEMEDIERFLKDEDVQFVVWSMRDDTYPKSLSLLREYLSRQGRPVFQWSDTVLYNLNGGASKLREVFNFQKLREDPEAIKDFPVQPDGQLLATEEFRQISNLKIDGAVAARYSVSFTCSAAQGALVARLDWTATEIYYRLVPCQSGTVEFSESVPIPLRASGGILSLEMRGVESAHISQLTIEFF